MATLKVIRIPPKVENNTRITYPIYAIVISETGEPVTGIQNLKIEVSGPGKETLTISTANFSIEESQNFPDYTDFNKYKHKAALEYVKNLKDSDFDEFLREARMAN